MIHAVRNGGRRLLVHAVVELLLNTIVMQFCVR